MNAILAGILRAVLALFAGTISTSNESLGQAVSDFIDGVIAGEPNKIGGALLTLGVILWSIYDKKKGEKK